LEELVIYWRIIRKRLWLIALLMVSAVGAMYLVSYLSGPRYRATASYNVTAPLPAGVSLYQEYRTGSTTEEIKRTGDIYLAVLGSEFVIGQVIDELGLNMEVVEFLDHVLITPDTEGTFTLVRVTADNPRLAADMANALLDKASRYFGEVGASALTANKLFIQDQLQTATDELDRARAALIQFQIENRLSSLQDMTDAQTDLLGSLKLQRDMAIAERKQELAAGFEEVIAERELELQSLILLNAEYQLLLEDVGRIQDVYDTLSGAAAEAQLKENEIVSATYVQVIPAREPSRPLPLVDPKVLLLGVLGSLALGVLLAFVLQALEHADTKADQYNARADLAGTSRDIGAESHSADKLRPADQSRP
jgi:capsular polysaccharide biosynthesis protein